MSYKKEILDKNQVKFTVEVDNADWTKAIDEAFNKTKHKFQIEGFRKGKVPRKMIEQMYGISVFFEDALDIILPESYGKVLDIETDIYPVARPDIDIIAISDTTLTFSAIVTCKPEVKLGEYKGLSFKKINIEVTDAEIDEEIAKDKEKTSTWKNITDRACTNGDQVIIDYSGSINSVKFEGGTAENQKLELGSNMFIPGFEEQVIGMNIGESKDIVITFPEDYGAEELANKETVFAVTLHEINIKDMPVLNDEFVKDVSLLNTVEEYKASIKEKLENAAITKANNQMETEMIDAIAEKSEIEIPEAMVESQIQDMIQEFEYRLMYQGAKIEDYYKHTNSSREELATRYQAIALKNVRIRLVMEAIIKAEKIEIKPEELDAKIADFAKGEKKEFEAFKAEIKPNQLTYIENEIVTDKLMTFLKENNKFN